MTVGRYANEVYGVIYDGEILAFKKDLAPLLEKREGRAWELLFDMRSRVYHQMKVREIGGDFPKIEDMLELKFAFNWANVGDGYMLHITSKNHLNGLRAWEGKAIITKEFTRMIELLERFSNGNMPESRQSKTVRRWSDG